MNSFIKPRIKYTYSSIFLLILLSSILYSCNKNVTVKLIEEHDAVVKTLEERDSMVVLPPDTNKVKQSEKH